MNEINEHKKFLGYADAAKSITLSTFEKAEILSKIKTQFDGSYGAVRNSSVSGHSNQRFFIISLIRKPMIVGLIISLILGGSTSFAAEYAHPGDLLYPVKIHVNENISGAAHVSLKSKAEWSLEKVDRRLAEANDMRADAKADADAHAQLQLRTELNKDVDEAKARIDDVKIEDADTAAALSLRLNTSLQAALDVLSSDDIQANTRIDAAENMRGYISTDKSEAKDTHNSQVKFNGDVQSGNPMHGLIDDLKADIDVRGSSHENTSSTTTTATGSTGQGANDTHSGTTNTSNNSNAGGSGTSIGITTQGNINTQGGNSSGNPTTGVVNVSGSGNTSVTLP